MSEGLGIARLRSPIRTVRPPRSPLRGVRDPERGLSREELALRDPRIAALIREIDRQRPCERYAAHFTPRDERVRYCGKCGGGACG